ncbi:hypothetical protein ABL78_8308 [Leptomonas seymouri]|uniref:Uncharacterized protein n=1 Tax=Leptomonas seymouri TaxID=5684 RepID=A0A0N0P2M0_LEPSE|nr:hypothetical protein ABL78_8308 [Leptomonas seymouri]|eukprot:KPI82677.1 hypothetical protein ABL78_8308 [Leptomonas seymouri]
MPGTEHSTVRATATAAAVHDRRLRSSSGTAVPLHSSVPLTAGVQLLRLPTPPQHAHRTGAQTRGQQRNSTSARSPAQESGSFPQPALHQAALSGCAFPGVTHQCGIDQGVPGVLDGPLLLQLV